MLSDRAIIGVVVTEPQLQADIFWYRIRLPDGRRKVVPESDIELFQSALTPADLLSRGAFGDIDDFRRTVTFHKLDQPLENALYAFNASRTEFYPHQYKPLVKFLGSRGQRLLIADEVGLGKTIEAGLIMTEQRARGALRRVMVVCPASLRLKWKEEMWSRFDEQFEILQAVGLRERIRELRDRGDLGETRDIISLESLRLREHLEMLEATPLPLDLLVIDEAHHLRNRHARGHQVCLSLAENASAVLLLTATPIHLGTENLFNLFRILDPAEFDDFFVFESRLRANEPVVQAQRLARRSPIPADRIKDRIHSLSNGEASLFFSENPIFQRLRSRIESTGYHGHAGAVELQQDLDDLNLLSHVFSRSKKRDVFADAPERSPEVVRVRFTREESRFYHAVTDFVRHTSQKQHGTIRFFSTMGAQRQVASSLQAARSKFTSQALVHANAENSEEEHDLDFFPLELDSGSVQLSENVIRAAEKLGAVDTKYDKLLKLLERLDTQEPGRKVLLFAYYKQTLNYLYSRLQEDGYVCELIHGDIKSNPSSPEEDERGKRMRRFRNDPKVRLLLSSEVGSEGLDFQFCHILVNYDLPWNPMRIEQRIGRLDRLGQASKRVIIFNFSVRDTIEDRVLHRLYERIGIFERSIGDLEAILGDEVEELQKELLSRQLTPEEEERRIDEAYRVIEHRRRTLERLEAESTRFVGLDSHFRDQLRRLRKGGGLLTSEDMGAFFAEFIRSNFPAARLQELGDSIHRLTVSFDLDSEIRRLPDSPSKLRFLQRIRDRQISITFDASTAYSNDQVEFLGAYHPIFHVAVDYYRSNTRSLHAVSALRLRRSPRVAEGDYLYCIFGVDIDSGRRRRRIDPLFLRLIADEWTPVAAEKASLLFGDMLRQASTWHPSTTHGEKILRELMEQAETEFLAILAKRRQKEEERNSALVQTRLASLEESHRARVQRKHEQLEEAVQKKKDERYIRLVESTIRNMEVDFHERRDLLEGQKSVRFSFELVACGLLRVGEAK